MTRKQRLRMDAVNAVLKVVLVTVLTVLTVGGCAFMAWDGGHPLWPSLGLLTGVVGLCLALDAWGERRSETRDASEEEEEEVRL